ncbi:MAG: hypothetical protein JSV80_01255 [Acidobacteriota bacterium]|nr:MAG: hypothetical protein JSV80_01255 [Acidobacteriota bacterium]
MLNLSWRLAWWLVIVVVIWLFGLNWIVDLAATVGFGILALRGSRGQLLLLLASLVVSLGCVELLARAMASTGQTEPYSRPDEKYEDFSRAGPTEPPPPRYESAVDVSFPMPHGDLRAIDASLPRAVWEPREIRFITDSLGFRNDADYRGQSLVLAGDSIAICSGTDQRDMLSNVLRDLHGLDVYSVAHPADPDYYFANLRWALGMLRGRPPLVRAIIVFFEGNDFVARGRRVSRPLRRPNPYDRIKQRFLARFPDQFLGMRALFNMTRRVEQTLFHHGPRAVEVWDVGGQPMAFLGSYIDAARAENLELLLSRPVPPELIERIALVAFAPTKYRVYAPLFDDGRGALPPPAGLTALRGAFEPRGVEVVDLTDALAQRARELLDAGEYVYWRDDTHWNAEGIRVGAAVLARHLH